jgi:hypothetical protein
LPTDVFMVDSHRRPSGTYDRGLGARAGQARSCSRRLSRDARGRFSRRALRR